MQEEKAVIGYRQALTVRASNVLLAMVLGGITLSAQVSGSYDRRGEWGELPKGMKWPGVIGISLGPDGTIYVLTRCYENSCVGRSEPPILKFDPSGKLLKSWGEGMFKNPHGLFVDPKGDIWTTDTQTHQVLKFNADGKLLMTIGKKDVAGNPPELLNEPTSVLTNKKGDIFITEGHSENVGNRVDRYSKAGHFIKSFGSYGSAPGMINAPHAIAMDSRGRLFIADRSNNRIEIFTQDGKFVAEWRQFGRPSGIFIAKDDTLYVSDSESNTSAVHSKNPEFKKGIRVGSAKDGKVVAYIAEIEAASTDPSGPENMTVDKNGTIYGANVRRRMIETYTKVK